MMLHSKLRADAIWAINRLGIYGEDYYQAWVFLDRRYSNRWVLIEKDIQALVDLPQIN